MAAFPRTLLAELVVRDWKIRYAGSWLGFLWALAQPLAQLVLFTFVFSTVMKVRDFGGGPAGFAGFLFCGLLPWMGVSEGLQRGAVAILESSFLVRKHRFPAALLVASVVLAALVQQAIATALFGAIASASGWLVWPRLAWLPVFGLAQAVLTLGLALLLAAVQVYFRDVSQALGLGLMFWFYATPIVYPMQFVPARWREMLEWNPLAVLVAGHRAIFLGTDLPPPAQIALLLLSAALIGGLGWLFFRRLEPGFSDEV
jgi:lipopolysaccharide transport system permease protein